MTQGYTESVIIQLKELYMYYLLATMHKGRGYAVKIFMSSPSFFFFANQYDTFFFFNIIILSLRLEQGQER